jgi:hypothetical protein
MTQDKIKVTQKIRLAIARVSWKIHDIFADGEPFNRLGCYIAYGKNWRDK